MGKETVFTDKNIKEAVASVMDDSEYKTLVDEVGKLSDAEKDCVLAFILGLTMKNSLCIKNNQFERSGDTCNCVKQLSVERK